MVVGGSRVVVGGVVVEVVSSGMSWLGMLCDGWLWWWWMDDWLDGSVCVWMCVRFLLNSREAVVVIVEGCDIRTWARYLSSRPGSKYYGSDLRKMVLIPNLEDQQHWSRLISQQRVRAMCMGSLVHPMAIYKRQRLPSTTMKIGSVSLGGHGGHGGLVLALRWNSANHTTFASAKNPSRVPRKTGLSKEVTGELCELGWRMTSKGWHLPFRQETKSQESV